VPRPFFTPKHTNFAPHLVDTEKNKKGGAKLSSERTSQKLTRYFATQNYNHRIVAVHTQRVCVSSPFFIYVYIYVYIYKYIYAYVCMSSYVYTYIYIHSGCTHAHTHTFDIRVDICCPREHAAARHPQHKQRQYGRWGRKVHADTHTRETQTQFKVMIIYWDIT